MRFFWSVVSRSALIRWPDDYKDKIQITSTNPGVFSILSFVLNEVWQREVSQHSSSSAADTTTHVEGRGPPKRTPSARICIVLGENLLRSSLHAATHPRYPLWHH